MDPFYQEPFSVKQHLAIQERSQLTKVEKLLQEIQRGLKEQKSALAELKKGQKELKSEMKNLSKR